MENEYRNQANNLPQEVLGKPVKCCKNWYLGELHTCAKQPGSSLRMDYGLELPMELSPSEIRFLTAKLQAAEEQIKLLTELRDCWKDRALLAENPLREAK